MDSDDLLACVERMCQFLELGVTTEVQKVEDNGIYVFVKVPDPKYSVYVPEITRLALIIAESDSSSDQGN